MNKREYRVIERRGIFKAQVRDVYPGLLWGTTNGRWCTLTECIGLIASDRWFNSLEEAKESIAKYETECSREEVPWKQVWKGD